MTITVVCKQIEIDADNDLQKILSNDARDQEIENCAFERVTVTDDSGKIAFESEDLNDFTVEDDGGVSEYTKYDYVQIQQCDDYCTKEIDDDFDPKKLVFSKYRLVLPDGEYDGIAFIYLVEDEEDSWENSFEHGEEGLDYEGYYKKVDDEWIEFDPEEEDEE